MTQPSSARPVPGPLRPAGVKAGDAGRGAAADGSSVAEVPGPDTGQDPFADLDQRPVDEHVTVFEAEHDRLQRRLGGIDQV
ncbi:MAG: hypothetical protein QOJ68_1680 [Blastococcus sp.]|jgi:hypothetical protein|nr:hypothetical protein [Blastococcus sp.]